MALTPITLTATFVNPDGTVPTGRITATLNAAMQNGTTIVQPAPIDGFINSTGNLVNTSGKPFVLLANDDAGTTPTGTAYDFVIQIDTAGIREFLAVIPSASVGGTVDLSELAIVITPPTTTTFVVSFAGRSGPVTPQAGDYTAAEVTDAANTTTANSFTGGTNTFTPPINTDDAILVEDGILHVDAGSGSKGYRFRTNGGGLDMEFAGQSLYLSGWTGGNFTGTQFNQIILSNNGGPIEVVPQIVFQNSVKIDNNSTLFSGSGAPGFGATAGDLYIRTDTPDVSTQVLYVYDGTAWFEQAPVSSVFGRPGAVTAQSGDYSATQISGLENFIRDNEGGTQPADNGLLAWTAATDSCTATLGPTAGTLYLMKIWMPADTYTDLWTFLTSGGAGYAAGENWIGIYDTAGNLVASTNDITSLLGSTGAVRAPLAAQYVNPTDGQMYVGLLLNATTMPSLPRSNLNQLMNVGAPPNPLAAIGGGGLTALPSTVGFATGAAQRIFIGAS